MDLSVRKANSSDINNLIKWGIDLNKIESEFDDLKRNFESS